MLSVEFAPCIVNQCKLVLGDCNCKDYNDDTLPCHIIVSGHLSRIVKYQKYSVEYLPEISQMRLFEHVLLGGCKADPGHAKGSTTYIMTQVGR